MYIYYSKFWLKCNVYNNLYSCCVIHLKQNLRHTRSLRIIVNVWWWPNAEKVLKILPFLNVFVIFLYIFLNINQYYFLENLVTLVSMIAKPNVEIYMKRLERSGYSINELNILAGIIQVWAYEHLNFNLIFLSKFQFIYRVETEVWSSIICYSCSILYI